MIVLTEKSQTPKNPKHREWVLDWFRETLSSDKVSVIIPSTLRSAEFVPGTVCYVEETPAQKSARESYMDSLARMPRD